MSLENERYIFEGHELREEALRNRVVLAGGALELHLDEWNEDMAIITRSSAYTHD